MSATIEQNLQIAELQRDVRELRRELAALRAEKERPENGNSEVLPHALKQFIDMTNKLVPGELSVENSVDPDYPDTIHVVFNVAAQNKPNDANAIIDTEIEWHRRARAIFPGATCHFRLAID